MLREAIDFGDESDALFDLLEPNDDSIFDTETLFKGWTVNDILTHLHTWNWAADAVLNDEPEFDKFIGPAADAAMRGELRKFENQRLADLSGRDLLRGWREFYRPMAERFASADPKQRVKWVALDMSVRSAITSRLMETWAHGQAIYDLLGVQRVNTDRIKSIAVLGILTFGWSFKNRGLETPGEVPYVRLSAPSGEIWEWNNPQGDNKVEGPAEEFCQVVTQSRNILDTNLKIHGAISKQWMAIAQSFAGPSEEPPSPGMRHSVG